MLRRTPRDSQSAKERSALAELNVAQLLHLHLQQLRRLGPVARKLDERISILVPGADGGVFMAELGCLDKGFSHASVRDEREPTVEIVASKRGLAAMLLGGDELLAAVESCELSFVRGVERLAHLGRLLGRGGDFISLRARADLSEAP